jgi:hypothetical protein
VKLQPARPPASTSGSRQTLCIVLHRRRQTQNQHRVTAPLIESLAAYPAGFSVRGRPVGLMVAAISGDSLPAAVGGGSVINSPPFGVPATPSPSLLTPPLLLPLPAPAATAGAACWPSGAPRLFWGCGVFSSGLGAGERGGPCCCPTLRATPPGTGGREKAQSGCC